MAEFIWFNSDKLTVIVFFVQIMVHSPNITKKRGIEKKQVGIEHWIFYYLLATDGKETTHRLLKKLE